MNIQNGLNNLSIINAKIHIIDAEKTKINNVLIKSENFDEVGLILQDSIIDGRTVLQGVSLLDVEKSGASGLDHCEFKKRVEVLNSKFRLSFFAHARYGASIELASSEGDIESVFESEIKGLRMSRRHSPEKAERSRRDLERACQNICDRHRQDGRKDLESRFRRMEIKARAQRADLDFDAKLVSIAYDLFSDFGRSLGRPILGFFVSIAIFSFAYMVIATFGVGGGVSLRAGVDWGIIRDSLLLAVDKAFPFGASVAEETLFHGRLVGATGGVLGAFVGLLGALQSVLTGVLIFLIGLAVRTRLLIG